MGKRLPAKIYYVLHGSLLLVDPLRRKIGDKRGKVSTKRKLQKREGNMGNKPTIKTIGKTHSNEYDRLAMEA